MFVRIRGFLEVFRDRVIHGQAAFLGEQQIAAA